MILILLFLLCSPLYGEIFVAPDGVYGGWEQFEGFKGYPPYITDFGYRAIADHVLDANHREFDPSRVKLGDSVYVGVWYLNWFQQHVHDKIPNPYVLMTCDISGYIPNPGLCKLIFDPKVVCWFAKNMLFTNHSKFYQLPMGQFYHPWMMRVGPLLTHLDHLAAHPPKEKDIFLYLNYDERSYGRRHLVADLFWDKPYCYNRNRPPQRTNFDEYWDELARSKFVLSPLGMEVDCTRTWESFILGTIPIVEHTFLDPLYDKLPILLIDDWHKVDEPFLKRKYEEIHKQPHSLERAYLDYWCRLIKDKQHAIRNGDLSFSSLQSQNFSEKEIRTILLLLNQHSKLKTPIIYKGNLTTLRPFQLAKHLPKVPSFTLLDVWTQYGHPYLKDHIKSYITIGDVSKTEELLSKPNKTLFLDLTHFRHKLFKDVSELDDFCHSLKKDLISLYRYLYKGDLLLGNMAQDPYVKEALSTAGLPFETLDNFFYLKK